MYIRTMKPVPMSAKTLTNTYPKPWDIKLLFIAISNILLVYITS